MRQNVFFDDPGSAKHHLYIRWGSPAEGNTLATERQVAGEVEAVCLEGLKGHVGRIWGKKRENHLAEPAWLVKTFQLFPAAAE